MTAGPCKFFRWPAQIVPLASRIFSLVHSPAPLPVMARSLQVED
jgi:hypothetical protein